MLDLDTLRGRCAAGASFEYLTFWGHTVPKDGGVGSTCLSNWYPALFHIDGVAYPSTEHWMMAAKARLFGDEERLRQILVAPDPGHAKRLGRQVEGFDDATWKAGARAVVAEGVFARFEQNPPLRDYLLGTGEVVVVEASPSDHLWGIGLRSNARDAAHPDTWRGANWLGFTLMEVRERLRRHGAEDA